jgi:hypothetical protein
MTDQTTRGDSAWQQTVADLGEQAGSIAAEAKASLRDSAEDLKDKARKMAQDQKVAGADQLASLGKAAHSAASELGKELPQAAGYIHSAAQTLENASSALRERSVEDLVSMFNKFATRNPAAAFAGSVLAGFALSRFLKSSSADQRNQS